MSLVIHGELMDRLYRHQRHFYDVTRKYYLLGRDRLIDRLEPAAGRAVLEIGCGTARNLVRAARCYPQAQFFGIDVSHEMLATAHVEVAREGLARRIQLAHGDGAAFDAQELFGRRSFDRVFVSYTLSMIPAWRDVLRQAIALLPPGGELHIVDFGGQERLPLWFQATLRAWLALFHVAPRDELEAELGPMALRAGCLPLFERPWRGYAQMAVVRRLP